MLKKWMILALLLVSSSTFADYVAPPYPFSVGGTSATTQQGAIDALLGGSSTTGYVARYSGSHWVAAPLQASDIPTLNQNTTGTAGTANNVNTVSSTNNSTQYLAFFSSNSAGAQAAQTTAGVTINPSTDTVSATTFVGALTGNATTATALASTPSQCTGSQFATGIAANGNANCATPSGGGGSGSTKRAFNTLTGSTYTLALTDGWQNGNFPEIISNSSSANVITIPLNSSVAFQVGDQVDIVNENTGTLEVVPASGVTFSSAGPFLNGPFAFASLLKTATDTWIGTGNGWTGFLSITAASGCSITTSGNFKFVSCTANGSFSIISGSGTLNYAMIGGGGSSTNSIANNNTSGGGAGGGVKTGSGTYTPTSCSSGTCNVVIGAGGTHSADGNQGAATTFNSMTSDGGGIGGQEAKGQPNGCTDGASGGGRTGGGSSCTGTAGEGNNGGADALYSGSFGLGGGGGGAGGVGGNSSSTVAGSGGACQSITMCGVNIGCFAGGGGGGPFNPGATAGAGGGNLGENGGGANVGNGGNGTPNSGDGGGGAQDSVATAYLGGDGGSGFFEACWQFQ